MTFLKALATNSSLRMATSPASCAVCSSISLLHHFCSLLLWLLGVKRKPLHHQLVSVIPCKYQFCSSSCVYKFNIDQCLIWSFNVKNEICSWCMYAKNISQCLVNILELKKHEPWGPFGCNTWHDNGVNTWPEICVNTLQNYYVTSIECTTVLRFIEQVINVIKNTIIINQHLTIHQASRDTYVLANKYQFIFIHLLAIIFEVWWGWLIIIVLQNFFNHTTHLFNEA